MGNRSPPLRNTYDWGQTLAYWRSHDITSFWSGRAFHDPASASHAYRLAQVIGYRWTCSPKRLSLAQRIPQAEWENEDAALAEHFGMTHADLIAAVLDPDAGRERGWFEQFLRWIFVNDPS